MKFTQHCKILASFPGSPTSKQKFHTVSDEKLGGPGNEASKILGSFKLDLVT